MKSNITSEREARERKAFKEQVKPYAKFVSYMTFGTSSIVTSALAALYVYDKHLTGWQLYAACTFIAITLTPAAYAIGRHIVQGVFNAAKEAKE